jgi:polar amino acid transport system substrate-binding protein
MKSQNFLVKIASGILALSLQIAIVSCGKLEQIKNTSDKLPNTSIEAKEAIPASMVVTFAYADVESFPYQVGNGTEISDPPGIALDIISYAAKELGYTVNFIRLPNRRVLSDLQAGLIDGAFCFSFREDRMEIGAYPMRDDKVNSDYRITTFTYSLYRRKGSNIDWDGNKFINLVGSIGANAGYSIVGDLKKMGIDVDDGARTIEQNLDKLKNGRILGYAAQDITTDFHVESGKYGEVEKLPIHLVEKDYFLLFSHQFMGKNPIESENLWKKIQQVREKVTKERAALYKQ